MINESSSDRLESFVSITDVTTLESQQGSETERFPDESIDDKSDHSLEGIPGPISEFTIPHHSLINNSPIADIVANDSESVSTE